jgi:hypothetical protein
MMRNDWDGTDRRSQWDGRDRRRTVRYEERTLRDDETDTAIVERERVIEVQAPPAPPAQGLKIFSPGVTIPILFSVLTTIAGFVFTLYNKVQALEYKQQTIFEKIDENKVTIAEIKAQFKEQDSSKQKLSEHISSVEETVMELFRQKK